MTESGQRRAPRQAKRSSYARQHGSHDAAQVELALDFISRVQGKRRDCPTFEAFATRWIQEYARANKQKPRGIDSKLSILKHHILPAFGGARLDSLTAADVQRLKGGLDGLAAKTVNNVLTVLGRMLRVAVEWGELDRMPCEVKFLKVAPPAVGFYGQEEYRRLIQGAMGCGPVHLAIVLLGGDAGLRMGEMIALDWADVDWRREQLHVKWSESQGYKTAPKSGKGRFVPMSEPLQAALQGLYAERQSGRVLMRSGRPFGENTIRSMFNTAQRRAGMPETGGAHILRHTFCSHLAMAGVPLSTIKALAGHSSIRTTERYVHLSPSDNKRAIGTLSKARNDGMRAAPGQSRVSPTGFEPVGVVAESITADSGVSDNVSVTSATRRIRWTSKPSERPTGSGHVEGAES